MPFGMRQQKLDKLCRGYKTLRPRLTKYCRGRVPGVPGGVDAYGKHTGWAKKVESQTHGHNSVKSLPIKKQFSLEDSSVNLQLNGY